MTIRELQEYLRDRLNAVEALVQGGCKAFAEDTRTVYDESAQFIREGGVAPSLPVENLKIAFPSKPACVFRLRAS